MDQDRSAASVLTNEPPEGVLAGESVPRENEVDGEQIYERLKQERVETLERHADLAARAENTNTED